MASAASVVNCIQNPPPTGSREALNVTAGQTDVTPWVRVAISGYKKKTDDGYCYFQYPPTAWPPPNWDLDQWYRINLTTGDVARTGIPTQTQFFVSGANVANYKVDWKVVQLYSPTGQNMGIPQQVAPLPENAGWASIVCMASFTALG
jgi:hypothetical protein